MDEEELEYGTDAEMDSECRVIGLMLSHPTLWKIPILPLGFCVPFHAAVHYAVITAILAGDRVDPLTIWERVRTHADAGAFGLEHLVELRDEPFDPKMFYHDSAVLSARAVRRCGLLFETRH